MVSRLEFSTHDPERALPVLESFFSGVRMGTPHGDFLFTVSSATTSSFSLAHYHLVSPNSSSSVDQSGALTVGSVRSGDIRLSTAHQTIDSRQPWLFPQERLRGETDAVDVSAISLSPADILRVARAHLGDETFKLKFTGSSPVEIAHGRQWNALIDYTRVAMEERGSLIVSDVVKANAFAHLASMLLSTFPNNFMGVADSMSDPVVYSTAVRRAIAFMDDNAQLPITIEDIARESRMSIRGLQYAFRSALDTTPTAYLRRVRVAGAHRSLQAADPTQGATVLAIATAWGFTHPGRFAKQYHDAYGVTPRRTLES